MTMSRYQTCFPISYGQIEATAGVADRFAFWRQFSTEAEARAALRARIERRIAAGELCPLWPHASTAEPRPGRRRRNSPHY